MSNQDLITVEVAYARPEKQLILTVDVPEGTSAREAVLQSGLLERFDSISADDMPLGIFGKAVKPEQPLRRGDRVEVYRPLKADPKEARRTRAKKGA